MNGTSWPGIARRIRVPCGFLLALLTLALARPAWWSLLASLALVLPGIALRAWAAGYVQKNRTLTIAGPYAYTRNPLYLGSLTIALGFLLATRSFWIGAIFLLMFLAIYLPVMRAEARFLTSQFAEYDAYAQRVPMLLPRIFKRTQAAENGGSFSRELYLKHREYNAILGSLAMLAALCLKLLWFNR